MYVFTIVPRAVHIAAGVFWVGATPVVAGFVEPTAAALGSDGGRFMQRPAGPARLSPWMHVTSLLTVAAGLILFYQDLAWVATTAGKAYSVGAAAGIAGWLVGLLLNATAAAQLIAIGREIQAQKAPASADQIARTQEQQGRLRLGARLSAVLLLVAVVAMAVARYL